MSGFGLLALWPLLGFATFSVQNAWPAESVQRRHAAVVQAERTARFFTAWEGASGDRRARASAFLAEARSPGAPDGRRPEFSALAAATRVLEGVEPDVARGDLLQRFADAIDLQPSPGVFAARPDGRGEPITVRFYRLFAVAFHEDVVLDLFWIGPRGREIRARSEPVAARHFETPGQVMFIRAPRAEAGTWWHLVPAVEYEGRTVRGVGIPVFARGPSPGPWPPSLPGADSELRAWSERGFRAGSFSLPETARSHPLGVSLVPLHSTLPGTGSGGDGAGLRLRWGSVRAVGEPPADGARGERVVLLVPTPRGECAESLFLGPVGRAWAELSRTRDVIVCAVEPDRTRDDALVRLVEGWKHALSPAGAVRVIVVARGEAAAVLPFLLRGDDVAVDGLVLCTERSGRPRILPEVPALVVSGVPLAAAAVPGETRAVNGASVFLRELTLPGRIGAWLEGIGED